MAATGASAGSDSAERAAGKTLSVAIIGAGGISGAHSGAITAAGSRVVLSAVVDPHADNRHKLAERHGAQSFDSLKQFLAAHKARRVAADAVIICTPPSARVDIVGACLKAGLHVLSEKPLAHNAADARKLKTAASRAKSRRAFVAYCHRFAPAVRQLRELAAAGKIGRVVRFENAFACDLPGHKDRWFSDPRKAGGGAYLDMGSHSIDLFHFLIGPSRTLGAVFSHKWPRRTETAATVLVESTAAAKGAGKYIKPGVAGTILSGWAETSRFTVSLVGESGMLTYDYEKPAELIFKDLLGKSESMVVEPHDVRFTRQLLAFADAVQGRGKSDLATFADGLLAAEAFEKAVKLAR